MLETIALVCVLLGFGFLVLLSYIDLKSRILPNELVLAFAVSGFIFHLTTLFQFNNFIMIIAGAITGGGILFVIRAVGNHFYKEDTLGLGDVKLMAAAGLWLGPEFILIALTAGALAGFFHGAAVAVKLMINMKIKLDIHRLSVPAGPGFAIGILFAAFLKYSGLPAYILNGLPL